MTSLPIKLICDICNKIYKRATWLNKHIKAKHPTPISQKLIKKEGTKMIFETEKTKPKTKTSQTDRQIEYDLYKKLCKDKNKIKWNTTGGKDLITEWLRINKPTDEQKEENKKIIKKDKKDKKNKEKADHLIKLTPEFKENTNFKGSYELLFNKIYQSEYKSKSKRAPSKKYEEIYQIWITAIIKQEKQEEEERKQKLQEIEKQKREKIKIEVEEKEIEIKGGSLLEDLDDEALEALLLESDDEEAEEKEEEEEESEEEDLEEDNRQLIIKVDSQQNTTDFNRQAHDGLVKLNKDEIQVLKFIWLNQNASKYMLLFDLLVLFKESIDKEAIAANKPIPALRIGIHSVGQSKPINQKIIIASTLRNVVNDMTSQRNRSPIARVQHSVSAITVRIERDAESEEEKSPTPPFVPLPIDDEESDFESDSEDGSVEEKIDDEQKEINKMFKEMRTKLSKEPLPTRYEEIEKALHQRLPVYITREKLNEIRKIASKSRDQQFKDSVAILDFIKNGLPYLLISFEQLAFIRRYLTEYDFENLDNWYDLYDERDNKLLEQKRKIKKSMLIDLSESKDQKDEEPLDAEEQRYLDTLDEIINKPIKELKSKSHMTLVKFKDSNTQKAWAMKILNDILLKSKNASKIYIQIKIMETFDGSGKKQIVTLDDSGKILKIIRFLKLKQNELEKEWKKEGSDVNNTIKLTSAKLIQMTYIEHDNKRKASNGGYFPYKCSLPINLKPFGIYKTEKESKKRAAESCFLNAILPQINNQVTKTKYKRIKSYLEKLIKSNTLASKELGKISKALNIRIIVHRDILSKKSKPQTVHKITKAIAVVRLIIHRNHYMRSDIRAPITMFALKNIEKLKHEDKWTRIFRKEQNNYRRTNEVNKYVPKLKNQKKQEQKRFISITKLLKLMFGPLNNMYLEPLDVNQLEQEEERTIVTHTDMIDTKYKYKPQDLNNILSENVKQMSKEQSYNKASIKQNYFHNRISNKIKFTKQNKGILKVLQEHRKNQKPILNDEVCKEKIDMGMVVILYKEVNKNKALLKELLKSNEISKDELTCFIYNVRKIEDVTTPEDWKRNDEMIFDKLVRDAIKLKTKERDYKSNESVEEIALYIRILEGNIIKIKDNMYDNFIPVIYKKSICGRRIAYNSIGIQNMKRVLRSILTPNHQDVDMVNAHPNIAIQFIQKNMPQIKTSMLQKYINKRKRLIKDLQKKNPGMTRNEAKKMFLIGLNGGNTMRRMQQNNRKPTQDLIDYCKECKSILKAWLNQNRKDYEKFIIQRKKDLTEEEYKYKSHKGAFFNRQLTIVEDQLLKAATDEFRSQEIIYDTFYTNIHDGFQFPLNPSHAPISGHDLKELSSVCKEVTGYKIKWSIKPIEPSLHKKEPNKNDLLIEENKWISKKSKEYNIAFADFETCIIPDDEKVPFNGIGTHEQYMLCYALNDDRIKTFRGENCAKDLLEVLPSNAIIYYHNLDYDIRFQIKGIKGIEIIEKDLILPGLILHHNRFKILSILYTSPNNPEAKPKKLIFKCSYSIISSPLRDFPKMFFPDKNETLVKEVMPYNIYTKTTVGNPGASITIAKEYLKPEDREQFERNIDRWNLRDPTDKDVFDHIGYSEEYCKIDVRILRDGYNVFRKQILQLTHEDIIPIDIDKVISQASVAFKFFTGKGCMDNVHKLTGTVRHLVQNSVIGGCTRTHNNQMIRIKGNKMYVRLVGELGEQLVYKQEKPIKIVDADINSLYPAATVLAPFATGAPKILKKEQLNPKYLESIMDKENTVFYIEIKITKINKHRRMGVIPCRSESAIHWDSRLCESNYKTVISNASLSDYLRYHKIEYEVVQGVIFDKPINKTIKKLMRKLYKKRQQLKKAKNPLQAAYKLLMNSFYGKTIQKAIEKVDRFFNSEEDFKDWEGKNAHLNWIGEVIDEETGKYKVTLPKDLENHENYSHIGSIILAHSKRIMNKIICLSEDLGYPVLYQDTDSMHMIKEHYEAVRIEYKKIHNQELHHGSDLGKCSNDFDLKEGLIEEPGFELYAVDSIFLGKKSYIDKVIYNSKGDHFYHFRMKGISQDCMRTLAENEYVDLMGLYKRLYENPDPVDFNEKDVHLKAKKFDRNADMFGITSVDYGVKRLGFEPYNVHLVAAGIDSKIIVRDTDCHKNSWFNNVPGNQHKILELNEDDFELLELMESFEQPIKIYKCHCGEVFDDLEKYNKHMEKYIPQEDIDWYDNLSKRNNPNNKYNL